MGIDYALILGAGLGSRMGEIGKVIPKVLWPVFFKSLLELQIQYCEKLGIKKIYLNTHFLHETIVNFIKEKNLNNRVTILYESTLLDSGGAIHNLASRPEINYSGNALLVNGDQFLFFNSSFWQDAIKRVSSCRAVLIGIRVSKDSLYNETVVENNQLVEIRKHANPEEDYTTYSGIGLLRLDGLSPVAGVSRFFETVADYKKEKIEMITPDQFEYWDFGTAAIYAKNIFKLKAEGERTSAMAKFLNEHAAFVGNEELYINQKMHSLDLGYSGKFIEDSICGKGIIQRI